MPLTPEEMQELAELEELEALEAEEAQFAQRAPSVEKPAPGVGKSAAAGVSQGMTMGYTPQIVGGITAGLSGLQDLINPVIDPRTGKAIPRTSYLEARDATNKELDAAAKAHPIAYYGGQIAGSLPGGAGAAKLAGKGATVAGNAGRAAAVGAAQGALYNPGDVEGVINPLQAGPRLIGGALGAGVGAIAGAVGGLTNKAAKTKDNIELVKSGKHADLMKGAIDDALEQVDARQLDPRDAQLRELIKGQTYSVNPDRVAPTFPRLAESMRKNIPNKPVHSPNLVDQVEQPIMQRSLLSGDRALRLKRAADSAADYGAGKPFDPSAVAKGEEAAALGNLLRKQLNADPRVARINEEMADIMAKKAALANASKASPVEALSKPLGSSGDALVRQVDDLAGSNLYNLGKDMKLASGLVFDPTKVNSAGALEMAKLGWKGVQRGAVETGNLFSKVPAGTKEAASAPLFEAKRRSK